MGLFRKFKGTDKISLLKAEITALFLFFVLSIAGCGGGGYAIKKSTDDQFSDKSLPILVTLEENYIDFKAPLGIIPTSQLIPYLFRDNGGNIVETGFHLINVRMSGGMLHLQNQWLNIRTGDEIVFIADGERISAIAHDTKIDHYTSNVRRQLTCPVGDNYLDRLTDM